MHTEHANPAIAAAMESIATAARAVADDPTRPAYHFLPPANWMNDPNGTLYHNGYYHLFYQHNPYGDRWGHIHWGHARSRDLVHWEHLPIALWPSTELGEAHCFSGCATIRADGTPLILYTKVGPDGPDGRADFEQWAALGDADLLAWQKHPDNPILSLEQDDLPAFDGAWRDPYLFNWQGESYLVLAVGTAERAGVALFQAADESLIRWRYRGLLHQDPRTAMDFHECPNFFPLGGKWVLLTSPYKPVHYAVGDFDPVQGRFTPQQQGILDLGHGRHDQPGDVEPKDVANFYASNTLTAPDGRCILLGWVRGFAPDRGWNGALALPRELTLGADGRPRQRPVAELAQLRRAQVAPPAMTLTHEARPVAGVQGDTLEIQATLAPEAGTAAGLLLRAAETGDGGVPVMLRGDTLQVGAATVTLRHAGPVHVQIFLDRSVLEVFVNQGESCVTQVIYPPATDLDVWAVAQDGRATIRDIRAWEMASIW